MTVKFETSKKGLESGASLLHKMILLCRKKAEFAEALNLTEIEISAAERFRNALVREIIENETDQDKIKKAKAKLS